MTGTYLPGVHRLWFIPLQYQYTLVFTLHERPPYRPLECEGTGSVSCCELELVELQQCNVHIFWNSDYCHALLLFFVVVESSSALELVVIIEHSVVPS
jgi:hypothetical protein